MKIKLQKVSQHGHEFYTFVCDPRRIIKYVYVPEADKNQPTQRPWNVSRVKEIAKYVSNKLDISYSGLKKLSIGLLPSSPVLVLTDSSYVSVIGDDIFLDLPDVTNNDEEDIIRILDGQHRLFSFLDEYIDPEFKEEQQYEMVFTIFKDLTENEVKELFMIINEKQQKVEPNVLRMFKRLLHLLKQEDEEIDAISEKLGSENISLLKGRIIIGGEKIKNGYKLAQVSRIIKKSGTYDELKKINSELDNQLRFICIYLDSWNVVYNGALTNPKHTFGKISGLRYILQMFPPIIDIVTLKRVRFTKKEISKIIEVHSEITDGEKMFGGDDKLNFRAETATIAFARRNAESLNRLVLSDADTFNPFEE